MANSSSIIDPGLGAGYDYDSLVDWEAQNLNLVTQAGIETAYCRSTNGAADTELCSIAGWTLSATYYIDIQNDDSGGYDYLLDVDGASGINVGQNDFYGWVRGLTIEISSSVDTKGGVYCGSSFDAGWIKIEKCLIRLGSSTAAYLCGIFGAYNSGGTATIYARNCILHDFTGTNNVAINIRAGYTAYIYNCTVADSNYGFWNNSATAMTCTNCLAYNNSDGFRGSPTTSYCATSQAEGLSGTGDRNSQTFTFVDAGANNFHLQSTDAGAIGYGLNLYNDATWPFQDDFDGNDRGGSGASWDIGADEYVATGITVSASKQDLTLLTQAPTVSISQYAAYSTSKQDLTFSVLSTSVSISAGINIDAEKQDLSFSINAIQARSDAFYTDTKRDITLSINSALFISDCFIEANKQDLLLSILEPGTRLDTPFTASKQDLTLSILQPSISTTQAAQVSASKQDLTFSALQAAVSTSAGIQVIIAKQDLVLSLQAPTVRLDSVQDDVTRDLTLSVNSATVSTAAEVNIAAGKQDLALSINTATVTAQAQNSYAASCQNVLLSVLSSFQKIDHYEAINKQDLTISVNSPSVSIDTLYAAAVAQTLSFSQLPIEFFITHNINAGKQDLSFSVNQVAVSIAQVRGALIAILNQENMQPVISVLAYQPRVAVN